MIMHMLPKGSRVLCSNDVYGGTYRLFTTVFNEIHYYTANNHMAMSKCR